MARHPSDDASAYQRSLDTERAKLSATYMNGLAIGVLVVGGFSPIFGGSNDFSHMNTTALALFGLRLLGCAVTSSVLHWRARDLLKDIR